MKKISLILFLSLFLLPLGHTTWGQDAGKKEWKLIWKDEFNGKKLNPKKWNVLIRETSKHDELQYYIPEEVYLQDGNLRIRSSKRDYGNKHYTSGRLDTKDKLAITYGKIEIRGKLPVGQGIWPAYWLYPQTATGRWNTSCRKP